MCEISSFSPFPSLKILTNESSTFFVQLLLAGKRYIYYIVIYNIVYYCSSCEKIIANVYHMDVIYSLKIILKDVTSSNL